MFLNNYPDGMTKSDWDYIEGDSLTSSYSRGDWDYVDGGKWDEEDINVDARRIARLLLDAFAEFDEPSNPLEEIVDYNYYDIQDLDIVILGRQLAETVLALDK